MTKTFVLTIFLSCILYFNIIGQDLSDFFILNNDHLISVKQKIENGNESCKKAYTLLLKKAEKTLKKGPYSVVYKDKSSPGGNPHDYVSLAPYFWPNPESSDGLPYIRKDGQRNPEVEQFRDRFYLVDMADDVEVLSLAYFFSGDEKYAAHASMLLKTFFLNDETRMNPNMNYAQAIKGKNDGRGAGLIESRHFIRVIESVKFINNSKSWKKEDDSQLKIWFTDFLNWMQTSKNGRHELNALNNHGTWYDAQRLSFALYTGQLDSAKNIIQNIRQRLDKQMDNDGSFPKELERTIALHYSTFNLYAFFITALLAENAEIDLWNFETSSSKSLRKGFDFLYPYLTGEKTWTGQQIKPFDFKGAVPLLLIASEKLDCQTCYKAIGKYGLKEENMLQLLLVSGFEK